MSETFEDELVSDLEKGDCRRNGFRSWLTLPHIVYAATLIAMGATAWTTISKDVAAQGEKIAEQAAAQDERDDKQDEAINEINKGVGDLKTGQAVLNRDVTAIGKTLNRIEDKLDRR